MKKALLVVCLLALALPAHARSLQSSLNLKVFEYGFGTQPDRYLGSTSHAALQPVDVPYSDTWYVQPVGPLNRDDLEVLAKEMKDKDIPGLDLSNRWDLSNASLAALNGLSQLHLLILTHTTIGDAGLAHLEKLTGLKYLILNNQTTDTGVRYLKDLKELEYLYLHRSKITDSGLAALKGLSHLKVLDVGGTHISNVGAKTLVSLSSLRQLDISDTAMTDNGLILLSRLPKLRTLYANHAVTDTGMRYLSTFKQLKILDLSGAPVTNAGVAALTKKADLEELALSGTRVDDNAMKYLAKMKHLRVLELSFTDISNEGLPALAGLPHLQTLSLSWGKLTEADIRALNELHSVKTIILNGEVLSPDVFKRIRSLARVNPVERKKKKVATDDQYALPSTPVPSARARGTLSSENTLQNVNAPRNLTVKEQGMPDDLVSSASANRAIALDSPKGSPMEIDVGASPGKSSLSNSARHLTGLKRIHQAELSQLPADPDILPGASPKIHSSEESPANSLGEIDARHP